MQYNINVITHMGNDNVVSMLQRKDDDTEWNMTPLLYQ